MTTKAELDKAVADSLKAARDAVEASRKPVIKVEVASKRRTTLGTVASRLDGDVLQALAEKGLLNNTK